MLKNIFAISLFSLSLFVGGTASGYDKTHQTRHHDIAMRVAGDLQPHKRFSDSRWSFYIVGLGACGKLNVASDFIVALNTAQFGSGYPGPHCFKSITMQFDGKTANAVIMDECPGCPYGGLDLSRGLFDHFASEDIGIIYGEWWFNDGSADNADGQTVNKPTSTSKESSSSTRKAATTSRWTSTSTWVAETTTKRSSTRREETSTSLSSRRISSSSPTSSSSASISTSSVDPSSSTAVSGLAVPSDKAFVPENPAANLNQNLRLMKKAYVQMGRVVLAGARVGQA